MGIGSNGRVGQIQYLRGAAIVDLNFIDLGAGIALGEIKDVFKVCAAPRVNALRIVTNNHHVLVPRAEQVNELRLQSVGVLVLIHQHKLESTLVQLAQIILPEHQLQPQHQEVIKIHHPVGLLARGVTPADIPNLFPQMIEPRVAFLEDFCDLHLHVNRK